LPPFGSAKGGTKTDKLHFISYTIGLGFHYPTELTPDFVGEV